MAAPRHQERVILSSARRRKNREIDRRALVMAYWYRLAPARMPIVARKMPFMGMSEKREISGGAFPCSPSALRHHDIAQHVFTRKRSPISYAKSLSASPRRLYSDVASCISALYGERRETCRAAIYGEESAFLSPWPGSVINVA